MQLCSAADKVIIIIMMDSDINTASPVSDVSAFHVPGTSTAYYIPNFVTAEEEEYLIRKVRVKPE